MASTLDLFRVSRGFQIDDSAQVLEGSAAPSIDAPVGSVYYETTAGGLYTKVAAGAGSDKWELLAKKSYVDQEITTVTNLVNALGDAFNYVGTVDGGASGSGLDLATLTEKDAGDYYKVDVAGYFKVGAGAEFYANVGDGLVWNLAGGVDKIDNTNSSVQGYADEITVSGSTDTGYTVRLDSVFTARVTDLEGRVTTAETDITNLEAADVAFNSALAAEQTARQAADASLASDLAAEVTARTDADAALTAALAAETTTRTDADAALTAALTTEQSARQAADTSLASALAAETTARIDADAILASDLAAEVTARQAADTSLASALAAETTARTDADTALSDRIGPAVTTTAVITDTNSTNANIQALASFVETSGLTTTDTGVVTLSDQISASMAKWIVYIQDSSDTTKVVGYEVFAVSNGTDVDYSRFSILKLANGVTGATVTVGQAGGDMVLTASTTGSSNITIKRVATV